MMHLGRKAVVAALAASTLMVAGCATETTYRPATGQGFARTGYSDRQIEPNRFLVSFSGNSVTSRDTVERYLFFRAAELTLQNGYDYFVMADRDTDLQTRTYTTPGFGSAVASAMAASAAIGARPGAIAAAASAGAASGPVVGGGGFGALGQRLRHPHDRPVRSDRGDRDAQGSDPADNLRAFNAKAVVDSIGPIGGAAEGGVSRLVPLLVLPRRLEPGTVPAFAGTPKRR